MSSAPKTRDPGCPSFLKGKTTALLLWFCFIININ